MNRSKLFLHLVLLVFVISVLACVIPFSLPEWDSQETGAETEAWQATVDEIKAMTRNQPIPKHFLDPEQPLEEDVFDPNQLLIPLGHLKLTPGYTLDFVYDGDGLGGRPVVYARHIDSSSFPNFEAYVASSGTCDREKLPSACSFLDFIESDGTEAGYFQWVLLDMMGDQFYLYWHANYNDAEIIASKAQLEAIVEKLSTEEIGYPLKASQRRQALKIDTAPIVTIESDRVMVRVVWFTKWGGFNESILTLSASAPHQVLDRQTRVLVEYQCGIQF